VVITSPYDSAGGTDAGAVYLFNGATGALISTLIGSQANENIGVNDGVVALSNGNYVIVSTEWNNGSTPSAGAVTWGSGTFGVSGTVSAANSLVGSSNYDGVGYGGVWALSNGNYVVDSPDWHNGSATEAGAVTWGSGTSGVRGTVVGRQQPRRQQQLRPSRRWRSGSPVQRELRGREPRMEQRVGDRCRCRNVGERNIQCEWDGVGRQQPRRQQQQRRCRRRRSGSLVQRELRGR